jgi:undecaprenyl-diphosphatase
MSRARWAASGVVMLAAFVGLGLLVSKQPLKIDVVIADALRGQYARPLGRVAGVVTDVFGPVLPVVLGVGLLLAAIRWRDHASVVLRIVVVLVLCRVTSTVFKPIFTRQRPRAYPDLSYPSGHVVSVASTGLAAALVCLWLAPRLVRRVVAIAVAATVLSAACRIVLGVHWLTDTIGAALAVTGIGLVAAVALRLLPGPRDRVSASTETA